jgi:hypothetical protein
MDRGASIVHRRSDSQLAGWSYSMTDETQKLADFVKTGVVKIESIWTRWEVYLVGSACLIIGIVIGHLI